jgi:hypothetical protein
MSDRYYSNAEVETPNWWAVVIGEMAGDLSGCVLVRHHRKAANEFDPDRAVKVFSKSGKSGWAAAYRLEDVQPSQGLGL